MAQTRRTTRTTRAYRTMTESGRPVAAGGVRRAAVGVLVGALAGLAALVVRRTGRR